MPDQISIAMDPSMTSIVMQGTLSRVFRDTLYPRNLFRSEATPELWATHLGGQQVFTRPGELAASTRPIVAGVEPTAQTYGTEQWNASAAQYAGRIDTHMPTSYVSLASLYLRNVHQLGLQASKSINRVVRDKLYNAATSGNTVSDVAGAAIDTTLHVVNLNGFTRKLFNGTPQLVSPANPIKISIPVIGYVGVVTGFLADTAGDELHGGTLTISPALGFILPSRSAVLTENRSRLVYSSGSFRIDDVTGASQFRLADVRQAVAQMQFDNVPPHEDGTYHAHLDPIAQSQAFNDNEFQRVAGQSLPEYIHYRRFTIAMLLGCAFYRNSECPTASTVSEDPATGHTTGFEMVNPKGVRIHRSLITGQGAVEEKYLDETQFISAAGVQGRIGEFAVTNNGIIVSAERIRLVMRAPQDALQQMTTTAWSFSGDWPVPTDELAVGGSSPATYRREVCIVSGE